MAIKTANMESPERTRYKADKRVFITVRISEEVRDKVQEILKDYDCSLNGYLRECLDLLIKEEYEKAVKK